MLRSWIWKFLGYGNGLPVNAADLSRILGGVQAQIGDQLVSHNAQMFEFRRQQAVSERRLEIAKAAIAGGHDVLQSIQIADELIRLCK